MRVSGCPGAKGSRRGNSNLNELDELRIARNDTVRSLVKAMDLSLPGEAGHAHRVAVMAVATGEALGMGPEELQYLQYASCLHDIGKLSLERQLLHKNEPFSDADREKVQVHALAAMRVIESLPWLAPSAEMIVSHHERWDGAGYPEGLAGHQIPLGARIISVCEAYDVLVGAVNWSHSIGEQSALDELRRCSGTQFDPEVVEAFLAVVPLIQPIAKHPD